MYEDGGGVAIGAVGTDRRLGCPSHDDLLDRIVACEREIAGAQARQLALIAEFARSRPPSVGERPLAGASEFAVDELAVELRLSRLAAGARLVLAVTLADRLPGTAAALAAGDLDLPRARVVAEGTSTLDPPAALAVEARVLPRAVTQTVGQLRASVARAVLAVDPAGGQVRHERAAAGRRVAVSALPDGMAELWALLPAPAASAVYTAIDLHARRTGHPADVPMDARRADALLELVTRHALPTHAAPTTSPPTSAVPTSAASTSVAPTSAVPTGAVPTTTASTSAAPTTAAPTCVAPITTAPTSAVPIDVVPTEVVPIGAAMGVALTDAVSADGPVAGGAAAGAVPMSAVPMSAGQDSAVPMSAGPGSTAPASAAPGSAVPGGAVPGGAVVVGRSALAPLVQVTVAASTLLGLDDLPGSWLGTVRFRLGWPGSSPLIPPARGGGS